MSTDSRQAILASIDAFLARPDVDLTESTFGRYAVNDGKFVPALRDGRRVWPETVERVESFIKNYVPSSSAKEHGNAPSACHAEQKGRNPLKVTPPRKSGARVKAVAR